MVTAAMTIIRLKTASLTYEEACCIAGMIDPRRTGTILLDLEGVSDATTSALARLIALRRDIVRAGGDLKIAKLGGRARSVYEINRLGSLLPQDDALRERGQMILRAS